MNLCRLDQNREKDSHYAATATATATVTPVHHTLSCVPVWDFAKQTYIFLILMFLFSSI